MSSIKASQVDQLSIDALKASSDNSIRKYSAGKVSSPVYGEGADLQSDFPSRNSDIEKSLYQRIRDYFFSLSASGNPGLLPPKGFATGGRVQDAPGIDTVPTMLSGGEFVVNSSAASRLGQSSLEKLNAGDSSSVEPGNQEEVIDRLDELIKATKESTGAITITVNSDGSNSEEKSTGSQEEDDNIKIAKLIRDQVLKVINEEKRLGGTLRRGV